jgi:hypothetical protein
LQAVRLLSLFIGLKRSRIDAANALPIVLEFVEQGVCQRQK